MRLMQVMAGARHGGAEAFFVRLTLALAEAGVTTRAVIRPFPERSRALRDAGIPVRELPFGGWFDLTTSPELAAAIGAFEADVVLSWMNRATRFVPRPPKIRGRRSFVHVGRLGGYYDLKYYRRCHHLIGNTRDIVDYIIRSGWPAGRAHYLPNFAAETTALPVPRDSLDTPEGVPLFLALGRLHPNKSFDMLIEALAKVPAAHLWLAGDGSLERALSDQAVRLGLTGRVHLLGWRDDVAALMASADALVCPSRHEPLGNTIIEAWAQGLPVIAADAQGPKALIAHGETGLLVRRGDVDALAAAMARLAGDAALAGHLREAAHAAYLEQFSKRAVVDRYIAFFERAMLGEGLAP